MNLNWIGHAPQDDEYELEWQKKRLSAVQQIVLVEHIMVCNFSLKNLHKLNFILKLITFNLNNLFYQIYSNLNFKNNLMFS